MIEKDVLLAGRYKILEKIDAGGSAYIYKGYDTQKERIIAIKILKPEHTNNEEFINRFKKEVHAAMRLNHRNIVRAYDAGMDRGKYFIVMDLIEGKTLKHLININGKLPVKYVISVAKKLCLALEYAHAKGFVHRDIKPHNILVDMSGEPYITDFGIAKNLASNTITMEDTSVMGSVHYFSPEQARGERADRRSDIYSLGILMYEMLCGKLPFDADTSVAIAIMHINEAMPLLTKYAPEVPESLNRIVLKATQKDKHLRYKTAYNMHDDLESCLAYPDGQYVKYTENKKAIHQIEEMNAKRSKRGIKKLLAAIAMAVAVLLIILFAVGSYLDAKMPKLIKLPSVVGLTQEAAKDTLEEAKLIPQIIFEYNQDVAVGSVIRQIPEANMEINTGADVTIAISKGLGANSMPNVIGISLTEAKTILEKLGIKISEIFEQTDGEIPIGFVTQQFPAPQERISETDGVFLTVKVSPDEKKVKAPDVKGLQLSEAVAQLKSKNFSLFFVTEEKSEKNAGTVISQNPQADMEQMMNKPFNLVLSKFDYPTYTSKGSVKLGIKDDNSSVKLGVAQDVNGVEVYKIFLETVAQTGQAEIIYEANIPVYSQETNVNKDVVTFVNDELVMRENVTFTKGG